MSLRTVLTASCLTLPLALAVTEGSAANYTFSSTGTFSDCVNCVISSDSGKIGWGASGFGSSLNINSSNYNGSTLTANPLTNQTGSTPAVADEIARLTWVNKSTSSDSTAASVGADYKLTLNFTQPSPGGATNNVLDIFITNTANNARVCFIFICSNTGDVNDTGSVTGLPASITVNGLVLSNFSFGETGDGSYNSITNIWSNPEDGTSTLKIFANIAVAPAAVPEPASLALLGVGLLGLGALRRRI